MGINVGRAFPYKLMYNPPSSGGGMVTLLDEPFTYANGALAAVDSGRWNPQDYLGGGILPTVNGNLCELAAGGSSFVLLNTPIAVDLTKDYEISAVVSVPVNTEFAANYIAGILCEQVAVDDFGAHGAIFAQLSNTDTTGTGATNLFVVTYGQDNGTPVDVPVTYVPDTPTALKITVTASTRLVTVYFAGVQIATFTATAIDNTRKNVGFHLDSTGTTVPARKSKIDSLLFKGSL